MDLKKAERNIGYTFKDKSLLKRALTLASADGVNNNQTLEFFGDAILEFIVSEKIYDEHKSEGQLTELRKSYVSDKALTPVSEKLGLSEFLIKGAGDLCNKKSVPSAYEAVLAAIYLDGGMDEARKFVLRTLDFKSSAGGANFKGRLQELMQGGGYGLPVYAHRELGTPQAPLFVSEVEVCGKIYTGKGASVKQADQAAAESALSALSDKN